MADRVHDSRTGQWYVYDETANRWRIEDKVSGIPGAFVAASIVKAALASASEPQKPSSETASAAPAAAADSHSAELEKLFNRTAKLNALVEQLIDQGKNEGVDFQRLIQVNFRLHADTSRLLEDSTKLFKTLEEQGRDHDEGKREIFAQLNELSKAQDTLSKTIEELDRAEQEKATKQQEDQARLEEAIGNLADTVEDLRRPQPSREEQPEIEQETAMTRSPFKLVAASVAATIVTGVLIYFVGPAMLDYYWAPKGGQSNEQSRISREPPVMPAPPALTKDDVKGVFDGAFTTFETKISGQVKSLETQVTTGLTTLTGQVNNLDTRLTAEVATITARLDAREQANAELKKAFEEQRDKQAAKGPPAQSDASRVPSSETAGQAAAKSPKKLDFSGDDAAWMKLIPRAKFDTMADACAGTDKLWEYYDGLQLKRMLGEIERRRLTKADAEKIVETCDPTPLMGTVADEPTNDNAEVRSADACPPGFVPVINKDQQTTGCTLTAEDSPVLRALRGHQ